MTFRDLVVGRDPFVSVGAPLLGLIAGGVLWQSYRSLVEGFTLVPATRGDWLLLGVLVLVPGLLAAVNDGLVACWTFDFGPLLAVYLAQFLPLPADPYGTLFGALALAAGVAVVLGSTGFTLGVGVREAVTGVRSWWLRRSMG